MTRPPVVFLPGFMCDARLFSAQAEYLERRGIYVCFADLGKSSSLVSMAEALLEQAPKRFCLAGLSMGGILAFEVLRRAADRVTHLFLMNTTAKADSAQAQRRAHLARISKGEFRDIIQHDLKPQYFAPANRTPARERLVMEMAEDLGPDVFVRQTMALMRRRSAEDMLSSIGCPAIVLAGADDRVCPPALHAAMAQAIPQAELVVVPDCGHLSSLEAGDLVSSSLVSLIERPTDQSITRRKGG